MINGKHGQGTHSTKMGADKWTENTPNAPKSYLPELSAHGQKFRNSMKKGFIGRPWSVLFGISRSVACMAWHFIATNGLNRKLRFTCNFPTLFSNQFFIRATKLIEIYFLSNKGIFTLKTHFFLFIRILFVWLIC